MKFHFTILLILIIAGTHLGAQTSADQVNEASQNAETMKAHFEEEVGNYKEKFDAFGEEQDNLHREIAEHNARYVGRNLGEAEYETYLTEQQELESEKESIKARYAELNQEAQRLLQMKTEVRAASEHASALRSQFAAEQQQREQQAAEAQREKERVAAQQKQRAKTAEKERVAEQQKQQEPQDKSGAAGALGREVGLGSVQPPAAPPVEPRNPAGAINNSRTTVDMRNNTASQYAVQNTPRSVVTGQTLERALQNKDTGYQKALQSLPDANEANAFNAEMMRLNPGKTQAQLLQEHKWAQEPNGGQAGTSRGVSDPRSAVTAMDPLENERQNLRRTEQIFDKGMSQVRLDSSEAEAIASDLKAQLSPSGSTPAMPTSGDEICPQSEVGPGLTASPANDGFDDTRASDTPPSATPSDAVPDGRSEATAPPSTLRNADKGLDGPAALTISTAQSQPATGDPTGDAGFPSDPSPATASSDVSVSSQSLVRSNPVEPSTAGDESAPPADPNQPDASAGPSMLDDAKALADQVATNIAENVEKLMNGAKALVDQGASNFQRNVRDLVNGARDLVAGTDGPAPGRADQSTNGNENAMDHNWYTFALGQLRDAGHKVWYWRWAVDPAHDVDSKENDQLYGN